MVCVVLLHDALYSLLYVFQDDEAVFGWAGSGLRYDMCGVAAGGGAAGLQEPETPSRGGAGGPGGGHAAHLPRRHPPSAQGLRTHRESTATLGKGTASRVGVSQTYVISTSSSLTMSLAVR